jgi:hypothetical protein
MLLCIECFSFCAHFELISLIPLLFQKNALHLFDFTQNEQYKIFIKKNRHYFNIYIIKKAF